MNPRPLRILVTGGGTGGHVAPAVAVIEALRAMAADTERANSEPAWAPVFLYVGSEAGIEKAQAEKLGIPFAPVSTGKLRRASSLRGLLTGKNIRDAFLVPAGIAQALRHVRSFRPDVVFSTGGYVSVPAVIAAGLLGIPVLSHEQTVQIGLANRISARFATKIALSFDSALADLPPNLRRKAIVTGNPIRGIIFGGSRDRAVDRFRFDAGENDLPTVYVTGGAQGAHVINEAVRQVLPELLSNARVIHQCGRQPNAAVQDLKTMSAAAAGLPETLRRRYAAADYIGEEIGDVFALADVLIGRSGAGTVTEAAALGLPAIYVPLVPTGGDEQTRNARRFAEIGAAIVIRSADLTGPLLMESALPLLRDAQLRAKMGEAAKTQARPNAACQLAQELLALVAGHPGTIMAAPQSAAKS